MIELRAGDLVSVWEPSAGMVGTSLRHAGEELLAERGGLPAWVAAGKTFGIPLLHPFANRLSEWGYDEVELPKDTGIVFPDEHGLPIHGLIHGTSAWQVESSSESRLEAAFDFGAHPELLACFPFPHRVSVAVSVDAGGLSVSTTVAATGVLPVPLSFGWHPYLLLPGVAMGEWRVASSVASRMVLDGVGIPTGEVVPEGVEAGPLGDREYDHLYADAAGAWFTLEGGGRRIEVRFGEGYTYAQLFVDQEKKLLAFEPMTAPTNALRSKDGLRSVAPGQAFRADYRIAVSTT